MMCSDYYDFFTVNGSGLWSVVLPVDNTAGCNTYTLAELELYWITDITECNMPNAPDCWDLISTNVSANGQNLVASGLSVTDLGGTPFVAGDNEGSTPTAVVLRTFDVTPKTEPTVLFILVGLAFISLSRRHGFLLGSIKAR